MELIVSEVKIPEKIEFNYEEMKKELLEKTKTYEATIYTDAAIKDAKTDRANLNKLKKALNDERLRMEREYMIPFNDFKEKIKELTTIIDKPIATIDTQIKKYDNQKKEEKKKEINEYFDSTENRPDWLKLEMIWDDRWLLSSTKIQSVKDNIDGWLNRINTEINTLEQIEEFSFEAIEEYKKTLDLNKAIEYGKTVADLQKKKQEAKIEKQKKEIEEVIGKGEEVKETKAKTIETETPKQWINFSVRLDKEQALLLKDFFVKNNIEYKAIRKG